MPRSEFQAQAGAYAGRVQFDVVRRTELKILDLAAREHVFGQHVIDADGRIETEDIFAVDDVVEREVAANVDAGPQPRLH